ncbi:MAG: CDP-alcohol phosphatidyltransferase family protein [Solirubrobacteraceae bacterium]
MREFVNAANLVTSGSLVAGVAALMLTGDGRLGWALVAIVIAAVLDSVDGFFARRAGVCGPFGCHLDSLSDLVAFGLAPALMLDSGVLGSVPVLGSGVCMAFVVAGAWRLARFPLIEDREHFIGLSIPPAGLIAAVTAVIAPPVALAVVLCLLLSLLMVSSFTVPTLAEAGRLVRRRRTGDQGQQGHAPVRVSAGRRARPGRDHGGRERQSHDDERAPA